ncbi:chromodomain-helicase-DNA-binding protein 1-like isoform X2 [Varanus komodoensis]|uniref:Chromodomain-helicase-DNA-binding protein 1-like n=1 Tax=Varanus komodoensis TaxID=61221 RepID=A0A8D2L1B7_VARKO|nr:chromodomain-helicase-DNA-binding protein 1-like isoform X2 [Varanus komodoensis]
MSRFFQSVFDKCGSRRGEAVEEEQLSQWGLTGIQLRPYQMEGVNWLTQCYGTWHGCILGDEMGLGKTCQAISLLVFLSGRLNKRPFLILCPLSVLNNWEEELKRFSPSLSFMTYSGGKEKRAELQQDLTSNHDFHILLTNYEVCLRDAAFLKRFHWACLVVDEAHRLKNQDSLLHKTLLEFSTDFRLLLTGTPIQNSLQELYAMLAFIEPVTFPSELVEEFIEYYHGIEKESKTAKELHKLLQPFLLRRVKEEVIAELPKKMEVVLYHGMSALQRKFYKAILMKDLDAFVNETGKQVKLQNVLIQLRKCVAHPYLFNGVEPEPFVIGDHLIETSGKLSLLDKLLSFLYVGGHRVLLFSQMTQMLDILQDYMDYRGYSYERLDGSIRSEERHLAIKKFDQQPIFAFLLSTRAGGVGINLTAADTVVFVDSDFNPQNDLQAAARAHRIGQKKPVKIIRLIGRDTVEEIIYRRAASKLQLASTVIEGGHFSLGAQKSQEAAGIQLNEILKFGLDKLLSLDGNSICDVELDNILGETREGRWLMDPVLPLTEESEEQNVESHMYVYEGKDYSKEPSSEDLKTFDQLLSLQKSLFEDIHQEGRALRNKANVLLTDIHMGPIKKRRKLCPEEVEARREKLQKAAAKRARIKEEKRKKAAEAEHQKRMTLWKANHYRSCCLESEESSEEEEEERLDMDLEYTDPEVSSIKYIMGDVTHPTAREEDAIIVHCVDDSGHWGEGGLFTALRNRSDQPKKIYELAGKMNDLTLGGTLLFPIDDKESRNKGQDLLALVVAQHRDSSNTLSEIKLPALERGLKKIYLAAKKRDASVHLPRIGYSSRGFNWYGTERLIRKYLATRGIPTFVYYFPRTKISASSQASTTSTPAFQPSAVVQK